MPKYITDPTLLKQLSASPFDDALQAERVSGQLADIARSTHQQESGGGKNTKTSNAGAVGGMQIVPATFNSVADKGWSIINPEHNARAGIRYLKTMYEKADGDPKLTAIGYYGGPGAIDKARKGIAVSDPRNPKAPNTLQYGDQVASRLPTKQYIDDPELLAQLDEAPNPVVSRPETRAERATRNRKDLTALARQAGLTARYATEGNPYVMIPTMIGDAANSAVNLGIKGINRLTDSNIKELPMASSSLSSLLTKAGLPEPQTAQERVIGDVSRGAAGAGGMIKAGTTLAKNAASETSKRIGNILSDSAGLQLASATAASGAGGITRESGGSTGQQIAATLAGGFSPVAIRAAKPIAVNSVTTAIPKLIDEALIPGGKTRAATRLFEKAAGDKREQIAQALRNAEAGETAGQAAAGTGSTEFAALQQFARTQSPTPYRAINDAQEAARRSMLDSVTPDEQLAIAARTNVTSPMRTTELNAANTAGIKGPELSNRLAQKNTSMVSALQNTGRLQLEANEQAKGSNKFFPVAGQPRIAARYSPNLDRAAEYSEGSKVFGNVTDQFRKEAAFLKYQKDSLEKHGLSELGGESLARNIDSTLGTPGVRASDLTQKTLGHVRDKIMSLTDERGIIDARDLYTIRKEIGSVVSRFSKETGNWDQKMVSGLQRDVQKSIDEAIQKAGGTGWNEYLKTFASMSRPIDQSRVLSTMAKVIEKPGGGERVTPFLNAMGQGESALLKKSTGQPRYNSLEEALTPEQMGVVNRIVGELERDTRQGVLAADGGAAISKLLGLKPPSIVGTLNPKIAVTNALMRRLSGYGGEKTNQALADLMMPQNTNRLADLLSKGAPKQSRMRGMSPYSVFPIGGTEFNE